MQRAAPPIRIAKQIAGHSEMAERIRAFNWAKTPLGPLENWSDTLQATVNLMLHSPSPTVVVWGQEMVFLYNDAAIPTLTSKHPGALGAGYRDVFHEAWDLVKDDVEACLKRGETAVRDNLLIPILLNGSIVEQHFSYSLIPVYDNGHLAGIYDVFRNTTETVLGARRLRESEARLKLATAVAGVGVFLWDTVRDQGSWENDRMYEIFGRTRKDGIVNGAAFLADVVHPDSRGKFREAMEQTTRNGQPFHFESRIFRPDRTVRWIEVSGELQSPLGGSDSVILGTIRDITESRQQQENQRENARHLAELAAIVSNSEDVILSKDLNGIVTSWNASAARLFGYSAEEMIGSSILRLIPEALHSDETTILESIRAGKGIKHFETVRVTKDGNLIDVSLTVSPIRDEAGCVVGASKILRDISERKRIEASFLQAEKFAATGRMAATIAHEINNPLEAVMNLLYLLRPVVTDPDGIQYLHSAETELNRVSHIAKQTLGYYREHASAIRTSLADTLRHAIQVYEPRCSLCGIEIQQKLESSTNLVLRRGEMMQVISNLIANAIQAMPLGGVLSISLADTSSPSEGVAITIRDSGSGIDPAVLPKVFDAFFTTRTAVGNGIGLFVSKQFIEGHGGEIAIQSSQKPDDHGTTVLLHLPLRTAYDETANEPADSA